MGKALSLMGRPFRNYNLENRAHKIIESDKPVPAPKHKSDQIDYEKMLKEHPEAFSEGQIKHEQLDKYLKDVYVTSHDPNPIRQAESNPNRPLPQNRTHAGDFEYGIKEPDKIPEGKTTLKGALQFISDHQRDYRMHTAEKIARDYTIPQKKIENVLKYCRVFEIYIPETRQVKAKFAGPSIPRIRIIPKPRKLLTEQNEGDKT